MKKSFSKLLILAFMGLALFVGCQKTEEQPQQSIQTQPANTQSQSAENNSSGDSGDQGITITKSEMTSTVKFYPYEIDGVKLEVMAVKASDGTIRTAFNTCQVCYPSGRGYYVQEGDIVICQNCGNTFRISQIEKIKGGCNPVPIVAENKKETDKEIIINHDFIKEALPLFKNWKS